MLICFGLVLGSCSSMSSAVADHWPHWAGGMPEDVPPRPGTPGYDAFIAHKQAEDAQRATDATAQPAAASETRPAAASAASAGSPTATNGGLY
jgi:hypothetical protein